MTFLFNQPSGVNPVRVRVGPESEEPWRPPFYFDLCVVRGTKFNFVPTPSYFSLKFLSVSLQNWFQNRNIDQQVSNEKKHRWCRNDLTRYFFVSSSKRFSIGTIATTSKNSKTKLKKEKKLPTILQTKVFWKIHSVKVPRSFVRSLWRHPTNNSLSFFFFLCKLSLSTQHNNVCK